MFPRCKKFRRIIQEAGFDLDGDHVVSLESVGPAAEAGVAATPSPKKRKSPVKKAAISKATSGESPSKKAKLSQSVGTDEGVKDEVVDERAHS
jgi:hypothetical protein